MNDSIGSFEDWIHHLGAVFVIPFMWLAYFLMKSFDIIKGIIKSGQQT